MKLDKKYVIMAAALIPVLALGVYVSTTIAVTQADTSASTSMSSMPMTGQSYKEHFMATISSANEVPPVGANTTGIAHFWVRSDDSAIDYKVDLANANDITAAHLHCAATGENGPVIVPLYSSSGEDFNGPFIQGTISMSNVLEAAHNCNPNIYTMAHLEQAMREGKIYFNAHSVEFPNGVARGQLMEASMDMPMPSMTPNPTMSPTPTMSPMPTNSPKTQNNPYYVFVSPDSYYKNQGDMIQFSGNNFVPNETVTITMNGSNMGTVTADNSGMIHTSSMMVPFSGGMITYTFKGATSNIPFTVNVSVNNSNPWITLSTYYAGDNAPVTVNGYGFGNGEQVHVWFGGMDEGMVKANIDGSFSFNTTVPMGDVGQRTVKAMGVSSHWAAETQFSQAF